MIKLPLPFLSTQDAFGSSIWDLIAQSGLLAQLVYVVLLAFSILSWTIIIRKLTTFRRVERQSRRFLAVFHDSSRLSEIYQSAPQYPDSPLAGVFLAGYRELNALVRAQEDSAETGRKLTLRNIGCVERSLRKASAVELTGLEKSLNWLATTGAVTPFVGLFGTVVGIINAFHGLGQLETTSIQAVAPGISEALVATAFGLFAAIPAVVFYNHFLSRIKHIASLLDDFATELANLVERSYS